jgi:predicted ATPase
METLCFKPEPTNWAVITAGPAAGKSSTIRELSARGYTTVPEASRAVIDGAISTGIEPDNVRDEIDFQEAVIQKDIEIEGNYTFSEPAFLDRSLADNIAYMQFAGEEPDSTLFQSCVNRYSDVFILERLDFEDDHARNENEEEAAAIHREIISTYKELGYDPVVVPVMSIDERVEYILQESTIV